MGVGRSGVTVWCDITEFPCVDYQYVTKFTLGIQAIGGRGGIRTHGGNNPTFDFESSAFNQAQPPFLKLSIKRTETHVKVKALIPQNTARGGMILAARCSARWLRL